MNELIQIEVVNGKPSVTSLQIAEHFGKEHFHVMRDIRAILEADEDGFGASNFGLSSYLTEQNKEMPMYVMSKDGFVLLVMGYNGPEAMRMKKTYIARFNEMEEQLRSSSPALPNFADPVEAARAWADKEEQRRLEEQAKLALAAKVEQDAPKVLFADSVAASRSSILIGDLAKLLVQNGVKIGQNRLFVYLREKGFLIQSGSRKNTPTQKSMEMGLFEVKEYLVHNPDGSTRTRFTTKVTGKGQLYFVKKFLSATTPAAA